MATAQASRTLTQAVRAAGGLWPAGRRRRASLPLTWQCLVSSLQCQCGRYVTAGMAAVVTGNATLQTLPAGAAWRRQPRALPGGTDSLESLAVWPGECPV
jgi:hypothetical protein